MKRKSLWQRYGFSRGGGHKQIVITAEKSETFIIRQKPRGQVLAWCGGCGEEIECLTIEQAVTITGLTARNVFRLIEAEDIHFCETEAGHLFVCPNSVASLVRF